MKACGAGQGRRPVVPLLLLAAAFVAFVALGIWQVERLAWKKALIARVEAGAMAAPVAIGSVPTANSGAWEYRRVLAIGTFDPRGVVLVTGTSSLGSGYWALAPLVTTKGRTIYVNRGFLPLGSKVDAARESLPHSPVTIVGLLRLNEPGGTLLRANRPAEDRWYSRDVGAIAARHGVVAEKRWFIDAQVETPRSANAPVPGLTIIAFANNHLGYALTWFALALLSAGAGIVLWRRGR